jgi:hypothetical protein
MSESEESPDERIEQARLRLAILENDDTHHSSTNPYWERLIAARQNLQQLLKQKDNHRRSLLFRADVKWRLIDR